MSASLATVVLERLFDGLIMLVFVFVTLPFAPLPPIYTQIVTVFSLVFGLALAFFLYLAANPAQFVRVWEWIAQRFLPERFKATGSAFVLRFVSGLQSLKSPREMLVIFASSALIWLILGGDAGLPVPRRLHGAHVDDRRGQSGHHPAIDAGLCGYI